MMFIRRVLLATAAPRAVVLIRLAVGTIFISEGIQKFLFPGDLGVGRFAKIGLPAPEVLVPFVGSFEILCGSLVLLGLATRLASIPLITIMVVAILSTKVPYWRAHGFWATAHEARVDYAMLLGASFLLIVGAGPWSIDERLWRTRPPRADTTSRSGTS
jgi:putative oxidoreductase